MAYNVIPEKENKAGYTLLKVMRKYINMIMYADLNVHTSDTMAAGRNSIEDFINTLQVCSIIFLDET